MSAEPAAAQPAIKAEAADAVKGVGGVALRQATRVVMALNFGCAALLARHCGAGGSLVRAAFLSACNDAVANVVMVAAGAITAA